MNGPVSLCGPPPYYWYVFTFRRISEITLFGYSDRSIELKCPNQPVTAKISDWTSVSKDETEIADALYSVGRCCFTVALHCLCQ
jgi:hypothetical protein